MEPLRRFLNYYNFKNLPVVGRLQHNPQGTLAAIHRFALLSMRLRLHIDIWIRKAGLELRIAAFADAGDATKPDSTAGDTCSHKIEAAI
jgi:hypothetical protein